VRQAIASVDPRIEVRKVTSLGEQIASTFTADRVAAGFIAGFSAIALLVASIGLYGTVAHGVERRTSEIGMRVALGAPRRHVLWIVARETVVRLIVGIGLGLALTRAAGFMLAGQLFGVSSSDMGSFALATLTLLTVTALATLRPIRRALRIDPVIALRSE
jgi:ABC-type antimicrobial peptide transport system permease subunit